VVSLDNKRAYSRRTAEEALLGGAMLRPEVFLEVQTELKATDFGDPLHRGIWETLEKLTGEGKTFTSFDVLSELQKKSEVDTERFLHIASHVPAGVAGQIETVKEASRMEGLRAALGSALSSSSASLTRSTRASVVSPRSDLSRLKRSRSSSDVRKPERSPAR
jgi:hypothetical protein